ncbi:MAG: CDGSH iron-sulfur domain-containing protein [Methylococcales bacterium]|nr:CDGSH iron-sulfur domain-containing protein [Methylococcales bacterium]
MTSKTNSPMPVDVEAGETYGWCSCGFSQTMPLCDRSHREFSPDKKSVKFVAEETKRIYLCGCSETQNPPFCDASHCDL